MTITDAISTILAEVPGPLKSAEIYGEIAARSLYDFKSKAPASAVRSQLRRHCQGIENKNSSSKKLFRLVDGDRYELATKKRPA